METPPIFPREWNVRKDTFEDECIVHYSHSRFGRGLMHLCDLLPGIAVAYNVIDAYGISMPSWFRTDSLFINFCIEGRCEINYGDAGSIVLEPKSASISELPMRSYIFPSGHYIGSELLFNPSLMSTDLRILFDEMVRSLPNAVLHEQSKKSVYTFSGGESFIELFELLIPRKPTERINLNTARNAVKKLLLLFASALFKDEAQPKYRHITPVQRQIIEECYDILAKDLSHRISAEELAAIYGISVTSLKNYFRCIYGKTPSNLAHDMRMKRARELLETTDLPVSRISEMVGYANHGKFAHGFKLFTGLSPLEYRKAHQLNRRRQVSS